MNSVEVSHLTRMLQATAVAIAGLCLAIVTGLHGIEHSPVYMIVASGLLCTGLYLAVYGIDRQEAKQHWRIVLTAITLGVISKYILIFSLVFWVTHEWRYAILAMAVAQIDPLSVAAISRDQRMSPKARTILNAWASFDDPVTAVATPLLLGLMGGFVQQELSGGTTWQDLLRSILPFATILVFVGLMALWRCFALPKPSARSSERLKNPLTAAMLGISTWFRLFSLPAVFGWFVRPQWLGKGRRADLIVSSAFYLAMLMVGILLAGGVDVLGGVALGASTYLSQIIVAWTIMGYAIVRKADALQQQQAVRDTWHVALAQQNGITAAILSLYLEPVIPGSVATVAMAVLVINLINLAANWLYERSTAR